MAQEERPNTLDFGDYLSQDAVQVNETILAISQKILATSHTPGIYEYRREIRRQINSLEEQMKNITFDDRDRLTWLQANREGLLDADRVFDSLPEEAQEQINLYLARQK